MQHKQPKVSILYASLTGNTEEMAYLLFKEFQKHGADVDVDELEMVSVEDFLTPDIGIIATYSYDSGDEILPEETISFLGGLGRQDLSGKVFVVLGSGQEFYDHFCGAVDAFEEQFKDAGALQGSPSLKYEWDISSPEDEQNLRDFAANILKTYRNQL